MESKSKKLRSGYTTGACAAAAAKAAAIILLRSAERGARNEGKIDTVDIPFPDGRRIRFNIQDSNFEVHGRTAIASVIKDAGDDPDVTHGAEIRAEITLIAECGLRIAERENADIIIKGGKGVGVVTKPGLAIPVGEAAINPVPRKMIREAVEEAVSDFGSINPQSAIRNPKFIVTISVPAGEELAKKTLNSRLGIAGGISILGTTGIVKPLSTDAYTASITSAMDVAKAAGLEDIVLSTGRTSEKAHMKKYSFPEEAYVMMGDYLEYALKDAQRHGFGKIHLCAQWAKLVKTAMGTPQTHVRHGALEAEKARDFLITLGIGLPRDRAFNTTREIYDFIDNPLSLRERAGVRVGLREEYQNPSPPNLPLKGRHDEAGSALAVVCSAAKTYCEQVAGCIPVTVHLVSYEGDIIAASE